MKIEAVAANVGEFKDGRDDFSSGGGLLLPYHLDSDGVVIFQVSCQVVENNESLDRRLRCSYDGGRA